MSNYVDMSRWKSPQTAARRAEKRRREQRDEQRQVRVWILGFALLTLFGFVFYLFLYAKGFIPHLH